MIAGITPRQADLLRFIRGYVAEHDGVAPSTEEMAVALSLSSKSGVARLVSKLEARGVIRRIKFASRSISLTEPEVPIEAGTAYALDIYCKRTKVSRHAVVDAAINEYLTTHQLSAREELP